MSDNIKVAIRIRPVIEREKSEDTEIFWTPLGDKVVSPFTSRQTSFSFDTVFGGNATNVDIFQKVVRPVVDDFLDGYNGTVFAYGQTASGKTYTMMGNEMNAGVIPMTVNYIFQFIEKTPGRTYLLRFSFIEIYNENVTDLLATNQVPLKIYDDRDGMTVITDINERVVTSSSELMQSLIEGEQRRHFGATCMNEKSSRSHTICKMIIESHGLTNDEIAEESEDSVVVSHLNLVDLAGSEKCGQINSKENRFKEGCNINRSLLSLSLVISKLSEGNNQHINYRDSNLTRILKPSLGGNSKTTIICNITPAVYEESLSTLNFANRARAVKNKPKINAILSKDSLLKQYEYQINQLKSELQNEKCQQSEVFQKKLEERDSHIYKLEEKLRTISQKLLVSSRPFVLPVISKTHTRRETWCGSSVRTSRVCSLGKIMELDKTVEFNSSIFIPSTNFEQESDMLTDVGIQQNFISDGNEKLFMELNVAKEELVSKNTIIDDFKSQIEVIEILKKVARKAINKELAVEREKFDKQKEELEQQTAELNNIAKKNAEIVDNYINHTNSLMNEVQSLRQEQEEREMAYEERLKELLNDNSKVKEISVKLETQIKKEAEESAKIIKEKCRIIEELQNEIQCSQNGQSKELQSEMDYENKNEELLDIQNEFAKLKEKYNLLLEELQSVKVEMSNEKSLLLQEKEDLNPEYSELESFNDDNIIKNLLNELVESVSTDEICEVKNDNENQIIELEKIIENFQKTCDDDKETLIKEYKEQIANLQETNQIADDIIRELKNEIITLLEEMDKKENNVETEKFNNLLSESQNLVEVEKIENCLKYLELKEENSNLQSELEILKQEVAERDRCADDAQAKHEIELKQLYDAQEQLKKELENAESILEMLQNRYSNMTEENSDLQKEMDKLKFDLIERDRLADEVQSKHKLEFEKLYETQNQLQMEIDSKEEIHKVLQNRYSNMTKENSDLQKEMDKLKIDLIERDRLADEVQSKHKLEFEKLYETQNQLQIEIDSKEEIHKMLQNRYSNVTEENSDLQKEMDKLKIDLIERDRLADEVQSKHKLEFEKLYETQNQLQMEIDSKEEIHKKYEKQFFDIKEENVNLKNEIEKLRDEVIEKVTDEKIECTQLCDTQDQLKNIMVLEKYNSEMKIENSNLLIDVEKLRQEISERVRLADEERSKLQIQFTLISKANVDLKEKTMHLQRQLIKNEEESMKNLLKVEEKFFLQKELLENYENQIFELREQEQQHADKINTLIKECALLEEVNSKFELCKTKLAELECINELHINKLNEKISELDQCQTIISEMDHKYELCVLEINAKTCELEQCKASTSEMNRMHELQIEELRSKISEHDTNETQLSTMTKGFEDLKLKLDQLQNVFAKDSDKSEELITKKAELVECHKKNLVFSNKIEALELEKIKLENELEAIRNQFVKESEEMLDLKCKVGNLVRQIEDLEMKNKNLTEESDIMLSNCINNLENKKTHLENELKDIRKQMLQTQEENTQSGMIIETLNNRIIDLESQNNTLSNHINLLETEKNNFEKQLENIRNQNLTEENKKEEIENIRQVLEENKKEEIENTRQVLEENSRILEETYQKQIFELTTAHEKKILDLTTQCDKQISDLKVEHETEQSKKNERIKFLEDNRDEMEEIVDKSRRELWEMIDAEKESHEKTKAELQDVKKLVETSLQSENKPAFLRSPLLTLSKTQSNKILPNSPFNEEELTIKNEELLLKNAELQKQIANISKQQVCQSNEFQLAESNKVIFKKDCEINELKMQLKKREAPLKAKIEMLNNKCSGYEKRLNDMGKELRRTQQLHLVNSATSEFQEASKTAASTPNLGIIEASKIELLEVQIIKLHQRLKNCVCNKRK